MYKLCKTEQSAARQRQLEEGLLSEMLIKRYDEISVSDLCDAMKIPRKSFYRYFSSKDGALHALIDHTLIGFDAFTSSDRRSAVRTMQSELKGFFKFWMEHKDLLDALLKSRMSGVLIERAIAHALSEAVMPKRFLPKESIEMQKQITMFCVCGLMSMVLTWHHEGYPQSVSDMAQIAVRLLEQPLFPNVNNLL